MTTDPKVAVLDVLKSNWDASQTVLANPPEFFSAWYTRDDRLPAVTVPSNEESVLDGGATGSSNLSASMQRLQGTVTIDCVAGTWEDCEDVGSNSADRNPKQVRWSLYDHASAILVNNNASATGLRSVMPGNANDITDQTTDPDTAPVFRRQLRATYVRDRRP